MSTGLLLIDIQNDYFQGGAYELFNAEEAAQKAGKVLDVFRKKKMPVFFMQHVSADKNSQMFVPYTKGIDFYKTIYPKVNESIIIKYTPDSFFQTSLLSTLQYYKIDKLVICGMMTHMCVDTTVRSAVNYGFKVTLIEDACTTADLQWKNGIIKASVVNDTFMAALNNTFAEIVTAEEWCKKNS